MKIAFSQRPRMSSHSDSTRLIHGRQWVSLKIKQARVSTSSLDEDPDIKAFAALEHKHVSNTPSEPKYFAQLLESFQHQGPNGTHTCLVIELVGPAVSSMLMLYNNFEVQETLRPDTILRASKQLLESIHAMHESGIVHGGMTNSVSPQLNT